MRYTVKSWAEMLDLLKNISDFPAGGKLEIWTEWKRGELIYHLDV